MKLELLKNKSLIWSTIGVLVLIIGIVVALQLIPEEQDIRQEAAVEGGVAQIRIEPGTLSAAVGESKKATVSINTADIEINGISTVLTYNIPESFQAGDPPVAIENITMQTPFGTTPWNCSNLVEKVGNKVQFEVNCYATGPYTTGGSFVPIFEFDVKGVAPTPEQVVLSFDPTNTIISRVGDSGPGGQVIRDILDIPTSVLRVTVTGSTTPPADKKITLTAPTLTCEAAEFTVSAEVTEGTAKKAGVALTFTYNDQTKAATTNDQGVATATFTKAATDMNVTATAAGYTTGTAAVALPTNCDGGDDDDDNTVSLSLSGLACGASDFTAAARLHSESSVQNKTVTFTYNNQTKTATTNSSGDASVKFDRASSNHTVRADAPDFSSDSKTATLPTGCSTTGGGSTTGLSCNQSCTATRDCRSGLSCISGSCRASQCSSDSSCGCADVDVAAANGTTELPQSGFDQTLALTLLGLLFLLGGAQLWWSSTTAKREVTDN